MEYDLQRELGVDILEFFRGRRPFGQLLRFAGRLSPYGHYKAALAQDEDRARVLASLRDSDSGKRQRQPLEHWSTEAGILADLFDRVTALLSTSERRIPPYPRPRTAAARIDALAEEERHRERVRMIAPPA